MAGNASLVEQLFQGVLKCAFVYFAFYQFVKIAVIIPVAVNELIGSHE